MVALAFISDPTVIKKILSTGIGQSRTFMYLILQEGDSPRPRNSSSLTGSDGRFASNAPRYRKKSRAKG